MKNCLKDLRVQKKWTQAELASRANVDAASICYYETRRFNPSLETAVKMGRALEVSVEALAGLEPVGQSEKEKLLRRQLVMKENEMRKIRAELQRLCGQIGETILKGEKL